MFGIRHRRNVNGRNYLSSLRNQDIPSYCGSSWAIATAASLSDRFRYQTNGKWPTHELAAQVLINCDGDNNGCSGGDPYYAYKYIYDNGIKLEANIRRYIKKYYPGSIDLRYLTLFGGEIDELPNAKVLIHMNYDGSVIINDDAPDFIKELFED